MDPRRGYLKLYHDVNKICFRVPFHCDDIAHAWLQLSNASLKSHAIDLGFDPHNVRCQVQDLPAMNIHVVFVVSCMHHSSSGLRQMAFSGAFTGQMTVTSWGSITSTWVFVTSGWQPLRGGHFQEATWGDIGNVAAGKHHRHHRLSNRFPHRALSEQWNDLCESTWGAFFSWSEGLLQMENQYENSPTLTL